jgi:hypothetical protein
VIWKLIRYSPAWRIASWASLIYAVVWLLLSQSNDRGIISAPFMLYMAYMAAVAYVPEAAFRCTFFDAALPVEGRDLWVSKMIVLLGMVWVPVLAMSAVGLLVVHDPALPFVNAAAGFTAILLAGQSFRIREFHEPLLAYIILLIAGGALMVLMAVALPQFEVRVLAGYLLANIAFFLLAWTRVPKSFTVAPTGAKSSKTIAATQGTSSPIRAWWKILRQLYLTYLFVLVGMGWLLGGATFITIAFVVPTITATARLNWRFLAHLPISPRKLFWAMWAPLPLGIFLGYEAAVHFPMGRIRSMPLGPRITAIDWAFTLALLLSWKFCFQSWEWRRMRGVPAAIKAVLIAVVPVGVAVAWISIPDITAWRRYGADPIPYFAVKWASALPENPWILAIVLVVPLAGLYWLVERAFCETEYSTTRTIGESYYHAR